MVNKDKIILIGTFRHDKAQDTAKKIAKSIAVDAIYSPNRTVDLDLHIPANILHYTDLKTCLREAFSQGHTIVALCSSGIIIRSLADLLIDKYTENPVIAVAEDGKAVIPLLGGHRGGNQLAKTIAKKLNIQPSITTASEQHLGFSLDVPPKGWHIDNQPAINKVMAQLFSGKPVQLKKDCNFNNFPPEDVFTQNDAEYSVIVTDTVQTINDKTVLLNPPSIVIGIGCERGCPSESVFDLVQSTFENLKISQNSISAIATIDLKADESALHTLSDALQVPIKIFSADQLDRYTDMVQNPSKTVYQEVGTHSVAEASALACAGEHSSIIQAKAKNKQATISIIRRHGENEIQGDDIGALHVIGTGPGDNLNHTQALYATLKDCDTCVGYGLYLDLVSNMIQHTDQIRSPLGKEQDRVEQAITLAQKGKKVALICSGDPGIYALATLVFEVLEQQTIRPKFRLITHPGITAMQAAAAKLGAPLGHDFLAISLSDLLTPQTTIRARLQAAATGDFVTSIYNPQSKTRRTLLPEAKEIFLQHRPPETPVAICRNIGRTEEHFTITTLDAFNPDQVDMLSLVMIGNSMTRATKNQSKTYLYTPRGYIEPINQPS